VCEIFPSTYLCKKEGEWQKEGKFNLSRMADVMADTYRIIYRKLYSMYTTDSVLSKLFKVGGSVL